MGNFLKMTSVGCKSGQSQSDGFSDVRKLVGHIIDDYPHECTRVRENAIVQLQMFYSEKLFDISEK